MTEGANMTEEVQPVDAEAEFRAAKAAAWSERDEFLALQAVAVPVEEVEPPSEPLVDQPPVD